jgi:putative Holliday junction resolvase
MSQLKEVVPELRSKGQALGLDLGEKTIGLSVGDKSWTIASSVGCIQRTRFLKDLEKLKEVIRQYESVLLVVGLPLNMNGTEGPRCQSVRQFVSHLLKKIPIHVYLQDERLSTQAVTRTLLEADVSRKRRGQVVDQLAAVYILQSTLDTL